MLNHPLPSRPGIPANDEADRSVLQTANALAGDLGIERHIAGQSRLPGDLERRVGQTRSAWSPEGQGSQLGPRRLAQPVRNAGQCAVFEPLEAERVDWERAVRFDRVVIIVA